MTSDVHLQKNKKNLEILRKKEKISAGEENYKDRSADDSSCYSSKKQVTPLRGKKEEAQEEKKANCGTED